jgi:hypothetical protein
MNSDMRLSLAAWMKDCCGPACFCFDGPHQRDTQHYINEIN